MVYAAAYCPLSFKSTLEEMGFDGELHELYFSSSRVPGAGASSKVQAEPAHPHTFDLFADSKALKDDVRQNLWESFETHPELCYSSATLSPQAISANMLRKIPVNLTRQAEVSSYIHRFLLVEGVQSRARV